MSIAERNRYLQILHKNGASRKQVSFIMKDIDSGFESGGKEYGPIFQDKDTIDYSDGDDFDRVAEILFNRDTTQEEKIDAEASLSREILPKNTSKKGKLRITEAMILQKQQEYIEMGLVLADDEDECVDSEPGDKQDVELETHARFGRSPLHEAVAYRNIEYVKKCIRERKYLDAMDNNGNTPREMAFYEGWMDAVKLFSEVC